jgi:hypothetical protein
MSDYFPDIDTLRLDLPLFASAAASAQARSFHERDEVQASVLLAMRSGQRITKKSYERDGSRLAPSVEQLRNAHGFTIEGHGTVERPYYMTDVKQRPTLARTTPEMKVAYYATPWWNEVRIRRLQRDAFQCVLCGFHDDLRCHHVSYANLFCEQLHDLMTVCDRCHDRVHAHCGLKFPSGISIKYAHLVGWKGFEKWLLP